MPRRSPTEAPALGRPVFVLNLKAYPASLGRGAMAIGEALARQSSRAGVAAAIAPAAPDLGRLAETLWIPVLAQHVDPAAAGARTGHVVVESLQAVGARGSLLNHSEHPVPTRVLSATLDRLRAADLTAVVCARGVRTAARLAKFEPPYLAVEPPELIGGTLSVSTARPEVISGTVEAVRRVSPRTQVLCGAGIHDQEDVSRALALGAQGILVASAVTTAPKPARAIAELLAGFSR